MKFITITLFLSVGLVSTSPFLPVNYNPAYYPIVYPVYQQVRQLEDQDLPTAPPTAPIVISLEEIEGHKKEYAKVDYNCTEEGLFLDIKAQNCRNYIQCFLDEAAGDGFRVGTSFDGEFI